MRLLITILKAAHCRSTHQHFVLDSLPLVETSEGKQLSRLLVHHHEAYLTGSKDPDKVFRDFQNHVLHVADNGWGGAARTADKWYQKLIAKMNNGDWEEAAYSAGVLSHYFTDPIMPLHTAQSKRESIYHRAMEWSVTKSYGKILNQWRSGPRRDTVRVSNEKGWLSNLIHQSATTSHQYYEELLDRYDLERGSKNPPAGFDQRSIDIFAKLFGVCISGWAQILDRAANETTSTVPPTKLGVTTIGAALEMPAAWITRRVFDGDERTAVQAILNEYQQTGTVTENLPLEVTTVAAKREADPGLGTKDDLVVQANDGPATETEIQVIAPAKYEEPAAAPDSETAASINAPPTLAQFAAGDPSQREVREKFEKSLETAALDRDSSIAQKRRRKATQDRLEQARKRRDQARGEGQIVGPQAPAAPRRRLAQPTRPSETSALPGAADRREAAERSSIRSARLSASDDLVDAPSIGPKTAKRFAAIGITTVRGFLAGNPTEMATELDTRWITDDLIRDWQHQAKLVCEIPSLCGYKAQLLVGVDCNTAQQLAVKNAPDLHQQIGSLAATSAGQRILRSSKVPPQSQVQDWIDDAINAMNDRLAA